MGSAGALPPVSSRQSLTTSRLKFNQLLHLNQARVQDLICNLTDTQASSLWHGHKGALEVRAGLIDTYMDTYSGMMDTYMDT